MNARIMGGIGLAGRILLSACFTYAAVSKMIDPQEFADRVAAYQILPVPAVNLVAIVLPVFELTCGLLVMSGCGLRVGALGLLGLLSIFIAALLISRLHGLAIDCGCFGARPVHMWIALLRDLVLLALAVLVCGWSYFPIKK